MDQEPGAASSHVRTTTTTSKTMGTRATHPAGTQVRALNYNNAEERHAATLLLTRAFVTANIHCFLGGVKRPGFQPPATTTSAAQVHSLSRDARNLYYFYEGMIASTILTGGRATVVAVPALEPPFDTREYTVVRSGEQYERLVVACLWNAPGAKLDDPIVVLKSKQLKTMTGGTWIWSGWGLGGMLRAMSTQSAFVKAHRAACKSRRIEHDSCWTFEIIGTDPDFENQGYGGVAMREGLKYIDAQSPPRGCVLEASRPRPKAIYEHFGWEETNSVVLGDGSVDGDGQLPSRGEKVDKRDLPGVTVWTMLRTARTSSAQAS